MTREVDDVSLLKSLFIYEPETGNIFWRCRDARKKKEIGRLAGTLKTDGYRRVLIGKHFVFCHRIAWAIHYGELPPEGAHTDHINGFKDDNRIVNLRICTPAENRRNAKVQANSTTGFTGVYRARNRYRAVANGKHLGMFDTAEDANKAYVKAIKEIGWSTSRALAVHAHEVFLA